MSPKNSSSQNPLQRSNQQRSAQPRHWIFLRGLARHNNHWGPFLDKFKQYYPEDKIELLDTAGNGTEIHRPSFTSVPLCTEDLRSRSQFLKQGHSVHLLSISLGSMVAIDWAHRHPNEVSQLVLINTSDRRLASGTERLQPKSWPMMLKIVRAKSQLEREKLIIEMTISKQNFPALSEKFASEFAQYKSTSLSNVLRQLYSAIKYRSPETAPRCPTLVINSLGDQMVDPICSQRIAKSWRVSLSTHPRAGHDLPLEEPDWICEQLTFV